MWLPLLMLMFTWICAVCFESIVYFRSLYRERFCSQIVFVYVFFSTDRSTIWLSWAVRFAPAINSNGSLKSDSIHLSLVFSLYLFFLRERERDSRLRHISLSIFSCVFVDSFIFPQRKQFTLFSPKSIFIFEIPIHNCFSLIWCSDLTKAEWLRS